MLRWSARARADLKAIHDYIAKDSPGNAKAVAREILARRHLARDPARRSHRAGAERRRYPRSPRAFLARHLPASRRRPLCPPPRPQAPRPRPRRPARLIAGATMGVGCEFADHSVRLRMRAVLC
ncbi:MAG: type II toxin-antitoxin system RelE/ParE family toxin [Gammaproteobacteria bacterium]|nr:type II toxin-antitoxin system RelE/ParE family toxin [Gammaproteobacteria bacterium]